MDRKSVVNLNMVGGIVVHANKNEYVKIAVGKHTISGDCHFGDFYTNMIYAKPRSEHKLLASRRFSVE